MANSELTDYITAARAQKVADSDIKAELVNHGWPENEVRAALNPTESGSLKLPPPPVPRFGMWVSFQYIILFISLYASATSLAGILHYWVDKLIPDDLNRTTYGNYFDPFWLKSYIATIIVTFPIFAVLFIILKKQLLQKPAVKNIKARKVLFYITLIGTFLIMIGHLIATIYGFLGGNTTTRSFIHLGVTFIVAGSIFGYLLQEVREDRKSI